MAEVLEQKHAATTAAITKKRLEQRAAETAAREEETIDGKDQELSTLIGRLRIMDRKDKVQVRDMSIRDNKRSTRHDKYRPCLKNSKDYERSQASRQEKREFSSHIREASLGNIEATRKGIADVVAKFCKDLYSSKNDERKDKQSSEAGLENTCDHPDDDIENDEQDRHILEFTRKEFTVCNRQSPKMEIGGKRGNQSRRYQRSWRKDILVVHELFNLIVKQNSITPSSWKKAVIQVIYKKGDGAKPENHRPFCGLQQHYKLFSTMRCNPLSAVLDRHHSAHQAGYRKTFRTTDHFMTNKLISQKSREWGTDMCVAASISEQLPTE